MSFHIGDNYIVDCIDLNTNIHYRWHLNFVPFNKAYRIKNEDLKVGTTFRGRYLILKVTDVTNKINFNNQCNENDNFWSTCPVCGSYLGDGICQVCRSFDWDSYHDND